MAGNVSQQDPVDTAWRIHGAIADWTGKVDTKASFVLTIESALLVKPRVRRRDMADEWRDNFVFFGHRQSWRPEDLEAALAERSVLPVLTRQLVNMSKIAWRKHLLVEVSMLCAVVGTALVSLA